MNAFGICATRVVAAEATRWNPPRPHQEGRVLNLNERKTPRPQRFSDVAMRSRLSFATDAWAMGMAGHASSLEGGVNFHARQDAAPAVEHGEKTCSNL
jgi:hypothetical protein